MNSYVADTMAIVLYLENRKLPQSIKQIFGKAIQGEAHIYFSAVSLMEIGYLSEKSRIDISLNSVTQLTKQNKNFILYPLDAEIVHEAFKIKIFPNFMIDLIAATAAILESKLITNDPVIQRSQFLKTLW